MNTWIDQSIHFDPSPQNQLTIGALLPAAPPSVRAAVVATSKASRTVRPMAMERSVLVGCICVVGVCCWWVLMDVSSPVDVNPGTADTYVCWRLRTEELGEDVGGAVRDLGVPLHRHHVP